MPAKPKQLRSLVNLIPQEALRVSRLTEIAEGAKRVGFVVLAVYAVLLVGVAAAFFVFSQERNSALQENQSLVSQVEGLRETEARLFTLKQRAGLISSVFLQGEKRLTGPLSTITAIAPAGVIISELTSEKGEVELTLQVQDTTTLKDFFDALRQSQAFSRAKLNTLARTPSGYFVNMRLSVASQ